jgi:hypothetical protein
MKFLQEFLGFGAPLIRAIENGKVFRIFFRLLYGLLAILSLLSPFYFIYMAADADLFSMETRFIVTFAIMWAGYAVASVLGFQVWWKRCVDVDSLHPEGESFIAVPGLAQLFQGSGEWVGIVVAVANFVAILSTSLILGDDAARLGFQLGLPNFNAGVAVALAMPILGVLIILITRALAEQFSAIVAIANNTGRNPRPPAAPLQPSEIEPHPQDPPTESLESPDDDGQDITRKGEDDTDWSKYAGPQA